MISRPKPSAWLIAALLYVVAVGLRLPGYDSGLPYRSEPDTYIVEQVEGLDRRGLFSRFDAAWKYPLFVATIVAGIPARAPALSGDASVAAHLAAASDAHRHARFVIVLLSALIAPATFWLARALLATPWAALAALFTATSLLHLCFSVQARPHGPAAAFTILGLVGIVRFARRADVRGALAAGGAVGVGVASLHTGLMLLAPLAVAFLCALRDRGRRALGPCALVLGCVVTFGAWAYIPGERIRLATARAPTKALIEVPKATDAASQGAGVAFSGHSVPLSSFNGDGFAVIGEAFAQYDPLLLALAVAGGIVLLALAWRRRAAAGAAPHAIEGSAARTHRARAAWVIAGYFAPASLVYGMFARTEARLVLSFVSLLALVGVAAVVALTGERAAAGARGQRVRISPRTGLLAVTALWSLTLVPAGMIAALRSRPDTATRAVEWVTDAARDGGDSPRTLCLNLISLPVFQQPGLAHPDAEWSRSRWERYQARLAKSDGGATAKRLGLPVVYPSVGDLVSLWTSEDVDATAREIIAGYAPHLVVLSTSSLATITPASAVRATAALRAALHEPEFTLVETFESSALAVGDVDVGFQTSLAIVLGARALGPRIEVWRRVGAVDTQR